MDVIKKMLNTINEVKLKEENSRLPEVPQGDVITEEDNFLRRSEILMEEAEEGGKKKFPITKTTPQFGDVRTSQEESIIKAVGEQVEFDDNSLLYYPDENDIVINAKIPTLNLSFQFRYQDPSGDGIYIWADALQMSDSNVKTLGKLRDAFLNFKSGLVADGDLLEKLKKISERE